VVYDAEFTAGKYGVYIKVPEDNREQARQILNLQDPDRLQEHQVGDGHG